MNRERGRHKSQDEQLKEIRAGGQSQLKKKQKVSDRLSKTFELLGNKCIPDIYDRMVRKKTEIPTQETQQIKNEFTI